MADRTLSEEDLYRFGRYAVGRRGYRPVVSLPESHALRLVKIKKYTEILAIGLFLISSALFFMNALGSQIPVVMGAFVIGFRALVIVLSHAIVAKTVVREVPEPADTRQDQTRIEGRMRSSESTPGLNIEAQVRNSELHVLFENLQAIRLYLDVDIESRSGIINVPGDGHQVMVHSYKSESFSESELVVDLDAEWSGDEQSDVLDVRVNAARRSHAEEHHYRRVGEFSIPVTISGANEMSSEVITVEYEFEILDE